MVTETTRPTRLFTLRLWQERISTEPSEWRGKVQALPDGEAYYFRDWPGLIRRNFVSVEDVADLVLRIWDDPKAVGQTIEIGGPRENSLTNNEVVALFERIAGQPAKVSHDPRGVLAMMSPLLRPLHPGLSQVMALALYEDTHDATFDATPLLRRYPLTLTRLEDWIRAHHQSA